MDFCRQGENTSPHTCAGESYTCVHPHALLSVNSSCCSLMFSQHSCNPCHKYVLSACNHVDLRVLLDRCSHSLVFWVWRMLKHQHCHQNNMYTSACICDLPCKNDLWDGSAQEYNEGSIAHTWSHKERIAAEDLLALSKPPGAISARLHPAGNLLYWHSATQVSCIHIHRTMSDIRSSEWVQCHHEHCELWPIFPGEPLTGRFLWSAAW